MGRGDIDNGIPEEAKAFKAPGAENMSEAFQDIKYCLGIGNTKTATEYLARAQKEGKPIDKATLQKAVQSAIDTAREISGQRQQSLDEDLADEAKDNRGRFDTFEHGIEATPRSRRIDIQGEKETVQKLLEFAKEQGIEVS